jgi:hypothetical protein
MDIYCFIRKQVGTGWLIPLSNVDQMYIKCISNIYHLYSKAHLSYFRYTFDIDYIHFG